MNPDFFNEDAFSLLSLTAVINKQDHIPGRAGQLAFGGVGEGVATTSVEFEVSDETLTLIQTSSRGGPSKTNTQNKRAIHSVSIPHVKLDETIGAHQIQNVRQLGSMDTLRGSRSVVDNQIRKQSRRHDLTLEHLRLGALRGVVLDADGSELYDLFSLFDVTAETPVDFEDVLAGDHTEETWESVRSRAQQVKRLMKRNLKMPWTDSIRIWAFVGDNFFDKLTESTNVKSVYDGYARAEQKLGENYAGDVFYFGGVFWENYQGTDDNSTVAIDTEEAQFFLTGVPGLYEEYYAPGDFMETVNTIGLPRYARVAPADNMNRSVAVHTQQNPLPVCTRPKTLLRATSGGTYAE